jgi:CheY-like chemotaxis protein
MHAVTPSPTSSRAILVVEDDRDIREILVAALEDEGFRTIAANNGRRALDVLATLRELPGLILLDLMMEEMGGREFLEVLEREHKDDGWADIPVLVSSAAGAGALAALPKTAGTFRKPFDLDELVRVADQYCPRRPGAPSHA